jgi:hypothetical protein
MKQNHVSSYIETHMASLGTLLAAYGGFYLYMVIRTGWVPTDGVTVTPTLASFGHIEPILSPLVIFAFFITSLPALLVGVAMLCYYTIRVLLHGLTVDSEHVAVLLTVFGFAIVFRMRQWAMDTKGT